MGRAETDGSWEGRKRRRAEERRLGSGEEGEESKNAKCKMKNLRGGGEAMLWME